MKTINVTIKNLAMALLVFWIPMTMTMAQESEGIKRDKQERIKAFKKEYIEDKVALTEEEAGKFWPLYDEYIEAQQKLLRQKREKTKKILDGNTWQNATDEQVSKLIDLNFEYEQKMLDLKKKFDQRFREALPIRKVGQFYKAERDFKKYLVKKIAAKREKQLPQSIRE